MTKAELETIIRWDREREEGLLFTADPREARRWWQLGYALEVYGTVNGGRARSWQATVPIAAVALLPLLAGRVRIPRWLSPPIVQASAGNARGVRAPEKADEIAEEIRTDFPTGEQIRRSQPVTSS